MVQYLHFRILEFPLIWGDFGQPNQGSAMKPTSFIGIPGPFALWWFLLVGTSWNWDLLMNRGHEMSSLRSSPKWWINQWEKEQSSSANPRKPSTYHVNTIILHYTPYILHLPWFFLASTPQAPCSVSSLSAQILYASGPSKNTHKGTSPSPSVTKWPC